MFIVTQLWKDDNFILELLGSLLFHDVDCTPPFYLQINTCVYVP